jgi:hypothetical protein
VEKTKNKRYSDYSDNSTLHFDVIVDL